MTELFSKFLKQTVFLLKIIFFSHKSTGESQKISILISTVGLWARHLTFLIDNAFLCNRMALQESSKELVTNMYGSGLKAIMLFC